MSNMSFNFGTPKTTNQPSVFTMTTPAANTSCKLIVDYYLLIRLDSVVVREVCNLNFVGCNNFARYVVLKVIFVFTPLQIIVHNFTEI